MSDFRKKRRDIKAKEQLPPKPPEPLVEQKQAGTRPLSPAAPASEAGGNVLLKMEAGEFIRFVRHECEKRGVNDFTAFEANPELGQILQAVRERRLLESIFARTPPAIPPQSRPTARPPPPPQKRESKPPRPTAEDADSGRLSGFEATVQSDVGRQLEEGTGSGNMLEVNAVSDFMRDLLENVRRDVTKSPEPTKKKCAFAHKYLDAADAFFNGKINALVERYGQGALSSAQQSARKKLDEQEKGGNVVISPLEMLILDLLKLKTLKENLAEQAKELDGLVAKEDEFASIQKNGSKTPRNAGAPKSSPPRRPPSRPPAAPSTSPPVPKQGPPTMPPRKQSISAIPPQAIKPKSWFGRMLSEYWLTTSIGIAAFSGAMLYRQAFGDLAEGLSRLVSMSGRQTAAAPAALVGAAFGAIMLSLVAVSEFVIRRGRIARYAERMRVRAQRSDDDKKRDELIIRKLQEIMLAKFAKTEDLEGKIKETLRNDMEFFHAMYSLRKDKMFEDILIEARVPDNIRGKIMNSMIPEAELEIMRRKLQPLASIVFDARERLNAFADKYAGKKKDSDELKDPVFHEICDELFMVNIGGDEINGVRARAIFGYVENGDGQNVGPQLLDALRQDYSVIKAKKG